MPTYNPLSTLIDPNMHKHSLASIQTICGNGIADFIAQLEYNSHTVCWPYGLHIVFKNVSCPEHVVVEFFDAEIIQKHAITLLLFIYIWAIIFENWIITLYIYHIQFPNQYNNKYSCQNVHTVVIMNINYNITFFILI